MLKPLLNHFALPLALVGLTLLASWGDAWVFRLPPAAPLVVQPSLGSTLGIESGILFVLQ